MSTTLTSKRVASHYYLSNTTYLAITNASNAYTDTSSTTRAEISNSSSANGYAFYFYGFDLSVPANWDVTDVKFKVKCRTSSTNQSGTVALSNRDTGTALSNTVTYNTINTTVYELTPNVSFDTIKSLGSNFSFKFSSPKSGGTYLYGMEVEITYNVVLLPNKVNYIKDGVLKTLIDLTGDDTLPEDVTAGKIFHLATGEQATGTASGGLEYESGTWSPTSNSNRGSISFSNTHSVPPAVVAINVTGSKPSNNRAVSNMAIDWQSLLGSIFSEYDVGAYTSSYVNSSGSWGISNGTIRYGGSDSGSSSTSYFRYFATETTFMPYSGSSSVYWATNKTYNWIAIWK